MESNSSPSVRVAVEAIRGQIRSGTYKAGSYLPPETGLAISLDLSRGTIRRAIDVLVGSGEISRKPYSRPRVESAVAATVPQGSEVHVWISHPIADGATLQFLKGISTGLMGTSLRLVVREPSRFFADHVKTEERQFLTEFLNDDSAVSAIIERDAYAENDDLYELLSKRGKNLVFVDTPPPKSVSADYVGTANLTASRRCTEHLIQQGHKRIVFVAESGPPFTVNERIKGYWRALRQAGMEEDGQVFIAGNLDPAQDLRMPTGGVYARMLATSSYYNERCQRLIREILKMDPRPTAIVSSCDVLALWMCAFLAGTGFSVPKEFAVTGFDWLARWDNPGMDVITTSSQDFEGFGYHAAELVLDRAYDESDGLPRQILLPAPLLIRSSTVGEEASVAISGPEIRSRVQHFR